MNLSTEQIERIASAFFRFWIVIYIAGRVAGLGYQEWVHDSLWAWAYFAQLTYRWWKWGDKPPPRIVMPPDELEDKIDEVRQMGYLGGYIFGVLLAGHKDYPVLAV